MKTEPAIVITTINSSDNAVLKLYAAECLKRGINCIIVGDKKTPQPFELPGAKFFDLEMQARSGFAIATLLPLNHYSRKNLGYLQAIREGHTQIFEVDDDNIPLEEFWNKRAMETSGALINEVGWANVYSHFTDQEIWPRGYPLRKAEQIPMLPAEKISALSPIQQFLADEDPDVDAVFRFYCSNKFTFRKNKTLILSDRSICPFNSQSTLWFRQAFPLLYLPSTCSFRMCDIWRSFIAQRIMRENGWQLSFHSPVVIQVRNEHDLHKDLEQELEGYLFNEKIVQQLDGLKLEKGECAIHENMRECYGMMVNEGYFEEREIELLEAWLNDLFNLG